MKLLKIILVISLPLFLVLGCKKDSTTTTTSTTSTTSTSSTSCTVSSTAVGKVGDNSSNLVTTALAKSSSFTKGLTVFGISLLATSGVSDAKLLHAANVTAELLDNDENGTVDNTCVVAKLNDLSTYVTMYNTDSSEFNTDTLVDAEVTKMTSLGANETVDNYADNVSHDASIEEIFHLITQYGYSNVYPTVFGESNTSTATMAQAMDVARGSTTPQRDLSAGDNSTGWDYNNTDCSTAGSVDNTSNDKAWYFYADKTADYQTMQTEYMYWSVSSKFGMHDSAAGLTKASTEWCPNTKAKLLAQDPTIYNLIDNSTYAFPTVLPNASYGFYTFKTADIITF
ncbi:MAG: hypothetical protein JKY07_08235 [SAR324 cluster bacterium]|nr:hypothetical protein [SAR324 cluster bacterium]